MPLVPNFPLGANGDALQDLLRRVEILEARSRGLQNGSIVVFDANNNTRLVLGALADGTYGLEVLDNSGNVEVKLGQLNASPPIYGLGVLPSGGTQLQQVGGFGNVLPAQALNQTNTSYLAFGAPNGVTTTIGPSGRALIMLTANIITSGTGMVGVQVDSGLFGSLLVVNNANLLVGDFTVMSGMTAGSHTFTMGYNTNGVSSSFTSPQMIVQPL